MHNSLLNRVTYLNHRVELPLCLLCQVDSRKLFHIFFHMKLWSSLMHVLESPRLNLIGLYKFKALEVLKYAIFSCYAQEKFWKIVYHTSWMKICPTYSIIQFVSYSTYKCDKKSTYFWFPFQSFCQNLVF